MVYPFCIPKVTLILSCKKAVLHICYWVSLIFSESGWIDFMDMFCRGILFEIVFIMLDKVYVVA